MRNLVSIKTITNLEPIPDADRIVKATIDGGWPVVVKKDEFKIDDKCVYFEIDSIVPTDDPRFKFLEKESKIYNGIKGSRIRSIKLKKTLSQGLALPIKEFEKELKEKDLTTAIKVQKWIPPEEMEIEPVVKSSSWRDFLLKCLPVSLRKKAYSYLYPKTSGTFPKWLKKTDQERIQNFSHWFTDPANLEHKYEITIKEDGSSITAFKKDNLLGVCSRNLCVWKQHIGFFSKLFGFKKFVRSEFYEIAQHTNLIKALQKLNMNIAVQGEFVGPGKNGNRSLRTNLDIYVFDIWLIDEMRYASVDERKTIFQKLINLGFTGKHVHTLLEGSLKELNLITIDSLLELAKNSKNPEHPHMIEGIVIKRFDGQMSFKAINNEYLIKHNL
jgi:hypothetical protein